MQIQNVLLTEQDLKDAVQEYLTHRGVKITVTKVDKCFGYRKEGYAYEASIDLQELVAPVIEEDIPPFPQEPL